MESARKGQLLHFVCVRPARRAEATWRARSFCKWVRPPTVRPVQPHSKKDEANLLCGHLRGAPVVEVVLKVAVADAELELLKELAVVHDVEGVEHVHLALQRRAKTDGEGSSG